MMFNPFGKKLVRAKNFFTLPAKEKRKMINRSAKEANRMQAELVKKYELSFYEASSR